MLFSLCIAVSANRLPNQFPASGSYFAHLSTSSKSKLCSKCEFEGIHHFNSDPDKLYGHVAWIYYARNKPELKTNFIDIFLGSQQEMYLNQGEANLNSSTENSCFLIKDYNLPIFNTTWSAEAKYEGTEWFHGQLCHKFSHVYPFFIQGEQFESDYYESVFTELPCGYSNDVAEIWYEWMLSDDKPSIPSDQLFLNVLKVNCQTLDSQVDAKAIVTERNAFF